MRSRSAQWLVAVGLGSSLVLAVRAEARIASAEPAAAETEAEAILDPPAGDATLQRTTVLVGVVEDDAPFSAADLAAGLESHFAGSEREARVEPLRAGTSFMDHVDWAARAADDPTVHAVFWIEPMTGGRYRLYLFDPATEQLWVRAVAQGDAEDVLETTSIMIRGAALGLAAGPPVGLEPATEVRPEVPAIAPTTEPAAAVETRAPSVAHVGHVVGLSYFGANLEDRAPWQSGLAGHLGLDLPRGAFVRLGAAFVARARTRGLTVWRVPVVIAAGYAFQPRTRREGGQPRTRRGALRIEVDASAVIEALWWRPEDSAALRSRPDITGRFALGPGAGVRWQLYRGLGIHARVRLEFWIANVDLVEERAGVRTTRFLPHPVSSALEAGIHYSFP